MSRGRGRPRVEINKEQLKQLCKLNCTVEEIGAFFECNKKTIERRMHDDPELRDIIEQGRDLGKLSIRREQFRIMEKGNATMAIWLGKQYLGQRDRSEFEVNSESLEVALQDLADALPE